MPPKINTHGLLTISDPRVLTSIGHFLSVEDPDFLRQLLNQADQSDGQRTALNPRLSPNFHRQDLITISILLQKAKSRNNGDPYYGVTRLSDLASALQQSLQIRDAQQ